MSLPVPEPGLVLRYFSLWLREHLEGREEGVKDRLFAIVLAARDHNDHAQVVVPVTHSRPLAIAETLQLPTAIKQHLGLDTERSWIVLNEQRVRHMGRPRALIPEQRAEAKKRRAEVATLKELAQSYNVVTTTISRLAA